MSRTLLRVAALALVAWRAAAAEHTLIREYDLDATSYTYCDSTDVAAGKGMLQTVGSNTTITTVGGLSAFGLLGGGDELFVTLNGTVNRRVVQSVTNNHTLVVTSAIDLSANSGGYAWRYRDVTCGTAATNGWVNVSVWRNKLLYTTLALETGTGGVDVSVECRNSGDAALYPAQILFLNLTGTTAPTNSLASPITENCAELRVGLKWHTANGAGPDSVTAVISGEPTQTAGNP